MIIVVVSLLGLVLGSFINAVVWRLKSGESISHGRSMCPECRHQLAWYDLVPVVSWVLLRGKCRYCKKPISVQYPLVELGVAGLFGLSVYQATGLDVASLGLWLALLVLLMILALYDAKWYELPNVVMHTALVLGLVYFVLRFKVPQGFLQLGASLAAAAVFYGLWYLSEGKLMGGADSKLVLLIGLILPPAELLIALAVGFILGGVGAAYVLLRKQKGMMDQIPFGPYLIAGLIIVQLYGAAILKLLHL